MNLSQLAAERATAGRPVRAALIGAGKFGSMFLSQVPTVAGLEVAVIADLNPDHARAACRAVGWDEARIAATRFTDDGTDAARAEVDVVIEATGNPQGGGGGDLMFHGLRRPAGTGERTGRAPLASRSPPLARATNNCRLPPVHARRCLVSLPTNARRGAGSGDEPTDVQFLLRRHQGSDRGGGDRQRLCPRPARREPRLSALRGR